MGAGIVRLSIDDLFSLIWSPVLSLRLLGGVTLSDSSGPIPSRALQRRRLAVLVVLVAAEGRAVSRDKLVGLLWPDADAERARHLLADSVYVLRSSLGDDVVLGFGDDLCVNTGRIECDLVQFARALEQRELTSVARLYAGPFLDGFHISDSSPFEHWADGMRSELENSYRRALEELANDASARGEHVAAVTWWQRLAASDRLNSRAALGLMKALDAAGDRAGAIQFARVHEQIVRTELESAADPAIATFAAELRDAAARVAPKGVAGGGSDAVDAAIHREPTPPRPNDVDLAVTDSTIAVGRSRAWELAAFAGLALAAATIALMYRARTPQLGSVTGAHGGVSVRRDDRPVEPSVAVLPFTVGNNATDTELAEGLTDDITHALTKLRGLRVVSPSTAIALNQQRTARSPIDTPHVRFLVEGTLRRQRDSIRVAVLVTDARDGTVTWSEQYDRQTRVEQIFAIEDEIARSIAGALKVRLSALTPALLVGRPPASLEAYERYRLGRHFWSRRNLEGTLKSIESFRQAIALDTMFAAAYAGLADSYMVLGIGNVGDFSAGVMFPRARAAARRALDLDSTLADAHAALGYVDLLYDLDWTSADQEFTRSLELAPSQATAHLYRVVLFEWTGHFNEAVNEARIALTVDFSPVSHIELGRALFFARQYDEAISRLKRAIELDSTAYRAHLHLGQVYEQQDRLDDAVVELKASRALSETSSRPTALLAHAYGAAGHRTEAQQLLADLRERSAHQYVPALDFAIAHAGLGDKQAAFAWLDSALADRSIRPYLQDPTFDAIRADTRYVALTRRLRLPWRGPLNP